MTGRWVERATARMTSSTRPRSFRHPEPPLRFTTFFTGQPKLMSMNSGWNTSVTSAAASPIGPGSAPKICTPIGRSSAPKRSLLSVASFSRRIPSAERNSVTTTSAPKRRQSRRNGDSDTPAIGARKSGTSWATGYGKAGMIRKLHRIGKCLQHQDLTHLHPSISLGHSQRNQMARAPRAEDMRN